MRLGILQTLGLLKGLMEPQPELPSMGSMLELAQMRRPTPSPTGLVEAKTVGVPRQPRQKTGGVYDEARRLAEAFQQAGYSVLNEYENPVSWATGRHLHVQWANQRDRPKEALALRKLAAKLGLNIGVGGWGTGAPHRGLAHKQQRALDVVIQR